MPEELKFERLFFEVEIPFSVDAVFRALTTEIGVWWPATKDARDVIFEARVGGRFYETWGSEQGLFYAMITEIRQNRMIRMTGPMGLKIPVVANIELEFQGSQSSTLVKLSHQMAGPVSDDHVARYQATWKEILEVTLPKYLANK